MGGIYAEQNRRFCGANHRPQHYDVQDAFESKRDVLDKFNINTSHLTGSSGTDIVFEPAFYYPDALKTFHLRNLEPADAAKYRDMRAFLRHLQETGQLREIDIPLKDVN